MPTNSQPEFSSANQDTQLNREAAPQVNVAREPIDPLWDVGGAVVVLIGSIVLQLAFSILFLIPYSLKSGISPASPDYGKDLVEFATSNPIAILLQVVALLPAHLLSFFLVWIVVTRFGKRPFLASLGWRWSSRFEPAVCVGLGLVMFAIASAIAWLLGTDKPTQLEQIINSSMAARYAIAGLAVFTAPLVEELIYRGVLYSALERLAGVTAAVVIVLGIFTLIHVPQYWPNFGVIAAVGLLSVVLTIIRAYTGRLLPCVVIHLVFNAIQSVLLIVEPYLPRLSPPPSDPTAAVVLSIARWALSTL